MLSTEGVATVYDIGYSISHDDQWKWIEKWNQFCEKIISLKKNEKLKEHDFFNFIWKS